LIPLFSAVREPAHLGQIVLLLIAVLAGFGVAGLARRWPSPSTWTAAAFVLVAAVNLEATRVPLGWTPFSSIPRVYDVLAREHDAVVAELPFPDPRAWFLNGPYMLNSTRHWRPMLNGYSGFRPASYQKSYDATRGFPDRRSLEALHELGVTDVVVHGSAFRPGYLAELDHTPSLRVVAIEDDIHIYRLR